MQQGAQLTLEPSYGLACLIPALLWLQTLGLGKLYFFLLTTFLACTAALPWLLLPRQKGVTQSPGVQNPRSAPTSATAIRKGSKRSTWYLKFQGNFPLLIYKLRSG